jgi:hypothetical protein
VPRHTSRTVVALARVKRQVRGKDKFIKMNSFGESLWAFWSDFRSPLPASDGRFGRA